MQRKNDSGGVINIVQTTQRYSKYLFDLIALQGKGAAARRGDYVTDAPSSGVLPESYGFYILHFCSQTFTINIIAIDDRHTIRSYVVRKKAFFCLIILFHSLVVIQMIAGQISEDRRSVFYIADALLTK